MQRLKLTTTKGKVFLSPFVYSDRLAKVKPEKLAWLVKKGAKLELVEVSSYPKMAIFTKDDKSGSGHRLTQRAGRIELLWNRLYKKFNIDLIH